jgi:hypothetical protein
VISYLAATVLGIFLTSEKIDRKVATKSYFLIALFLSMARRILGFLKE